MTAAARSVRQPDPDFRHRAEELFTECAGLLDAATTEAADRERQRRDFAAAYADASRHLNPTPAQRHLAALAFLATMVRAGSDRPGSADAIYIAGYYAKRQELRREPYSNERVDLRGAADRIWEALETVPASVAASNAPIGPAKCSMCSTTNARKRCSSCKQLTCDEHTVRGGDGPGRDVCAWCFRLSDEQRADYVRSLAEITAAVAASAEQWRPTLAAIYGSLETSSGRVA